MKYQIEDFLVNTEVNNPSANIGNSYVEFIMNANPMFYNGDVSTVAYWKCYMRPDDESCTHDSYLENPLTFDELVDYLKSYKGRHRLNAYPRKSDVQNCSYYCKVCNDLVQIHINKTNELIALLTFDGKTIWCNNKKTTPMYKIKRNFFDYMKSPGDKRYKYELMSKYKGGKRNV